MKKFICRLIQFNVPLICIILIGLLLPVTPRAAKSLLMANIDKDELLKQPLGSRIIFVGGSNLSFGLKSETIKQELGLNPINTAVHASSGAQYMLSNTEQYIKAGDVIILALEYSHYYRDYHYTSEVLLRNVFDVNRSKISLLSVKQKLNILKYVPKYAFSKIKPSEYFGYTDNIIYSADSFNEYGDAIAHWGMPQVNFKPKSKIKGEYNSDVIKSIMKFNKEIEKKKAKLYVTYPAYQQTSFMNAQDQIHLVASELRKQNLNILGTPERYRMNDNLMFNTPYHLGENGAELRTQLLIEDYKKIDQ